MSLKALALTATLIGLGACSTAPTSESDLLSQYQNHKIRHTIREVAEYDIPKMISLMNKEFNSKTTNEEKYFRQAVAVYGQTILIQPHFDEREATIREFKSKIEQSEYLDVIPKAAEDLISFTQSDNPSDQASALLALTNLVVEVRSIYAHEKEAQPDLKALLYRIRDAKLKVSDNAKRYAHEQVSELVSPSDEAGSALNTLLGPSVVAEK